MVMISKMTRIFLLCGVLLSVGVLGSAQQMPPVNPAASHDAQAAVQSQGSVRGMTVSRADVVKDAESELRHTNIAFLVGIGDYDRDLTGLPPLKYPVSDIMSIGEILKREGYAVSLLTDRSATAGAIRSRFKELSKELDKGEGTFIFCFSGHGFRTGTDNYLATFGTTISDLDSQGLSLREVQSLLLDTGAKRRMAFIDACRNDPEAKSVGATRSFGELQESEGLRILYSTAPGEVSYEDEALHHGVFSYFLVEGLTAKAANTKDGIITFDNLREFVTRNMKTYGISTGRMQKPYQLGESTGDFLVAIPPQPSPTAESSVGNGKGADVAVATAHLSIPPQPPVRVAPGKLERVQTFSTGVVHVAALSPDGHLVALAGHDGSVQLWDVESGKLTASLAGPGKPARCLQFSPDSKLLAAGDERALWVWEVETKTAHEFQDKGMSAVLSTSFSSDRKFLVTSSADKTLRVWNVETRRPEATSRLPIQGVWTGFAPDPKCNLVVFLERDSKHSIAGLWNWRLKRSPAMLADSSGVHCLAFAPDGRKLVGGMDNGTIRSWDLADSDNPQHGYEFDGHIGVVESVVFQSNGRLLASAGADKTFRWWDAESANNLRSWDAPPRTESVFALSFASDGRLLVATARAAEVEIWQIPLP